MTSKIVIPISIKTLRLAIISYLRAAPPDGAGKRPIVRWAEKFLGFGDARPCVPGRLLRPSLNVSKQADNPSRGRGIRAIPERTGARERANRNSPSNASKLVDGARTRYKVRVLRAN